jgi:hypothetical protein
LKSKVDLEDWKMDFRKFQINLNNGSLTIGIDKSSENSIKFYIHYGGGRVNFELIDFEKLIKIIEELGSIKNLKKKDKHISLNEYVQFHRNYISDTSKSYNYEYRISEKDKRRNESSSVYFYGIEQLNLAKESLIKLNSKYHDEVWLYDKIKSEGLKYVEYNGKKIEVDIKSNGILRLDNLGIKKISDISGLKEIKYLRYLSLSNNEIEEIEGLDHLIYLRELNLSNNYIKEIKGLDELVYLENLSLHNNPITSLQGLEKFDNLKRLILSGTLIPKKLFQEAGIKDSSKSQDLIMYINAKREDELRYTEIKEKTIEYLEKASEVFEEITYSKIISKTGIVLKDLEEIVEDLIFSGKIKAKIRKDGIAFIEENPLIGIALETVDVLHEIKDDTELISQYTSYIEDVFDKTENIEEYLRSHLGSEFEKIQNAWQDYKEGKIDKREFIKTGIKEIGKKFIKVFLKKL